MRTILCYLMACGLAAGALMGCASGKPAPDTDPGAPRLDRVAFLDDGLDGKVEVLRLDPRRTPTNTVAVDLELANRESGSLNLECRVRFYGADLAPLGPPSAWQRVILQAGGSADWSESSLSEAARHYLVEIREAKR